MKFRLPMLGIIALVLLVAACAPPPALRDNNLLADSSLLNKPSATVEAGATEAVSPEQTLVPGATEVATAEATAVAGTPELTPNAAATTESTAAAGTAATNASCASPCWHNITPGVTRWVDALAILQDDPNFTVENPQQDDKSKTIGVVWSPKGGTQCCQMVAEDGQTVNLIFLRTRPDHNIGEVIAVQGEPKYAVGTPYSDDQAIVNLVYPEKPMLVFVFTAGEASGAISASSEVIGVLYTTPKDMDLFMKTNNLYNWKGYQPYSAYKNSDGAQYDITPSVTLTPTPAQ
jgi:hypothetical protein